MSKKKTLSKDKEAEAALQLGWLVATPITLLRYVGAWESGECNAP